ncbi:MAG: hypothetical protein PHD32_09005 [Eubacteriales bacterium]|nr:hypothetical protein [Eubacteriales bacterium]
MKRFRMAPLLCALMLSGCAATYPNHYLVRIEQTPQPTGTVNPEEASGYLTSRYYARQVAGLSQDDASQHDLLSWMDGGGIACVDSPLRAAQELPKGDMLYRVDYTTGFTEEIPWPQELAQRRFEVYDAARDGDKLLLMCYGKQGQRTLSVISMAAGHPADLQVLDDHIQLQAYGWSAGSNWSGVVVQTDQAVPTLLLYSHETDTTATYALDGLAQAAGTAQPYYMARGHVLRVSEDGTKIYLLLKNGKFVRYSMADEAAQVLWDFGRDLPHAFEMLQDESLVYTDGEGIFWAQAGGTKPYAVSTESDLFCVSDDGRQVAYLRRTGENTRDLYVAVLYKSMVYERYRVYNDLDDCYNHMRWSADGKKLLLAFNSKGPKNETLTVDKPYAVFDFS